MLWWQVLLGLSLVCGLLAWWSRHPRGRVILINLSAISLGLSAFELYFTVQQARGDGTRMAGSITQGFTHRDNALGYAPDKNTRVTAQKLFGDHLIYDVTYTVGGDGLRVAASREPQDAVGCVVFFGDSVTFGEGVNDEETFAYQVWRKTGGDYAVYNFAFSGYGAHQMLAAVQAGRVEEIVDCKPTLFIYYCIPDHVARVAGLDSWDKHGPRFALDAGGNAFRDGNFDSPYKLRGWTLPHWLGDALESFLLWQRLFGRARQPGPKDLALLVAVIGETARITHERYPLSKFRVIIADYTDESRVRSIESGLHAIHVPTQRLTSIVPDFSTHRSHYVLAHDGHPNARLHERLADYIVSDVLARKKAGPMQRAVPANR